MGSCCTCVHKQLTQIVHMNIQALIGSPGRLDTLDLLRCKVLHLYCLNVVETC